MKSKFWAIALMLLVIVGCRETTEQAKELPEKIAIASKTDTSSLFQDLDGTPVALNDYKGKRVLLNYWATWCRPCIEEMPAMMNAQTLLKDDNYVFLLASDQSVEKISAFKEKKQFDFTFLKFNGSLAAQQINALPVTFIYNELGEQVERIDGATEWDSPEIIKKLKDTH